MVTSFYPGLPEARNTASEGCYAATMQHTYLGLFQLTCADGIAYRVP